MIRVISAAALALSVAGCGLTPAAVTAATGTTISKAQQDVQAAINLYGVAKGIGEVAVLADPTLTPVLAAVTSAVDPLVTQAQAALNDATTDANALETLASTITAQANALTVRAAPSITAVPGALPG